MALSFMYLCEKCCNCRLGAITGPTWWTKKNFKRFVFLHFHILYI